MEETGFAYFLLGFTALYTYWWIFLLICCLCGGIIIILGAYVYLLRLSKEYNIPIKQLLGKRETGGIETNKINLRLSSLETIAYIVLSFLAGAHIVWFFLYFYFKAAGYLTKAREMTKIFLGFIVLYVIIIVLFTVLALAIN